MPTIQVARNHPAGSLKTFTDCTATFLGFTQGPSKLIGHKKMIRPMMPTKGFISSRCFDVHSNLLLSRFKTTSTTNLSYQMQAIANQ
jgi:hypothetical protein